MRRDDATSVVHILEAARKARGFVAGKKREDLEKDEKLALSLVRLLEIIGEAASGVSDGYRTKHADIPWKKMVGLRNRLIHGYFDIDLDIIWDTVTGDLPPLIKKLEKLVP